MRRRNPRRRSAGAAVSRGRLALGPGLLLRGGLLLGAVLFLLLELLLHDLAGRVARQLVDELDLARDLEAREIRLHVLLELVLARLAVAGHDERLQALAELLVLDADDRHVGHAVVLGEQVLDLAREDVLAAGDDHLVVAAVDEETPLVRQGPRAPPPAPPPP